MALKLTQLAAKPSLIRIVLDDEDTVKEYGDEIEFWIYDRQPIDDFVKLATAKPDDLGDIIHTINNLLLDEAGNKVITDDQVLPNKIIMKVVNKVADALGK